MNRVGEAIVNKIIQFIFYPFGTENATSSKQENKNNKYSLSSVFPSKQMMKRIKKIRR